VARVRDERAAPEDLVFYEDYLGERDATFTLNFSGSSAFVLAQYYNFVRHGRAGYASFVRAMDPTPRRWPSTCAAWMRSS
jgi:glutamate decarboxylase